MLRSGSVVADRFEVSGLAGAGGMGTVYRARDRIEGRWVALKVLDERELDPERFLREARALSRLRHPAIVGYVAHGVTAVGERYLAMEWLEGESLVAKLALGMMPVADVVVLARRIASALEAIHAVGIVHRDVKPANVLLPGGDAKAAKLVDFGIARIGWMTAATRPGAVLGTPGYMAPEQVVGEDVDARADVFSLGCVLYRCLTGRPTFGGDHPTAVLARVVLEEPVSVRVLAPAVPEALDALVMKMLKKEMSQRPMDGGDVCRAIDALDQSESPRRAAASSLGEEEKRLHTVVLAGAGERAEEPPTMPDVRTRGAPQPPDRLEALVGTMGGRIEYLAAGPIVVSWVGAGEATDQAARAARAALGMRALLPGRPLSVATGSGSAAGRWTVGEVIDRAVSLQGPSGRIRVDELTAGLLGARFDVSLDDGARELRGERDATTAAPPLLGRETRFVGRDRDLGLLQALFEECRARSVARAVLVTGDAGLGKSRLLWELVRAIGDRAEVWRGRGDAARAGAPFAVLSAAIRGACGLHEADSASVARRKVADRVARRIAEPEAARVRVFLAEIAGTPFPDQDDLPLAAARADAVLMGDQTRRAFEDFLDAETRARPVVLVLEDLHWGDAPTVRAVESALRILKGRPLFVVAAARPEVEDRFPKLWADRGVSRLRLGPLGRRAAEALAKSVLGDDAPADQIDRLVHRAEGNALFLEELLRAEVAGGPASSPTVLAMLRARLEALPATARRILRAASVFGRTFRAVGAAALAGTDARAVTDELAAMGDREVLVGRGDAWEFRHDLVRDAAYAMLTDDDRVLGHRLAAQWLEAGGERDALVLAEHFERGRVPAKAADAYLAAARQALEGNDFDGAVARADQGIACGAAGELRAALRGLQAEAYKWSGRTGPALEAASDAMANLPAGSALWCVAAAERAIVSGNIGRVEILVEVGEALLAIPKSGESDAWLAAAATSTTSLSIAGLGALAGRLHARLPPPDASSPGVEARLDRARATVALAAGDAAGYLSWARRAMLRYEASGDRRSAAAIGVTLGHARAELGDPAGAEEILRDALATAERLGLDGVGASARKNLGIALAKLGRFEEAIGAVRKSVETVAAMGISGIESTARAHLAAILARAGDAAGAEAEARAAVRLASTPSNRAFALGVLARLSLSKDQVAPAKEAAAEAFALLESLGSIYDGESEIRLVRAETLHAAGEREAAVAAITSARAALQKRAAGLPAELRPGFLTLPENARTLELAKEWSQS